MAGWLHSPWNITLNSPKLILTEASDLFVRTTNFPLCRASVRPEHVGDASVLNVSSGSTVITYNVPSGKLNQSLYAHPTMESELGEWGQRLTVLEIINQQVLTRSRTFRIQDLSLAVSIAFIHIHRRRVR